MEKMKCTRCKYTWYPRVPGKKPGVCPKCKSYRWDEPKKQISITGLDKIIDDGTNIVTVPKDFYLKNGKLNPKNRNTYPSLEQKKQTK